MGAPRLSVQICADQLRALAVARREENPVVRCTEMRGFAIARKTDGFAASNRHPVKPGFSRSNRADQIAAAAFFKDDGFAVRRKARARIMAGRLGNDAAGATIGADSLNAAKTGVGPAHIGDHLAVGRPCGIGLHRIGIVGQATRFAPCHRLHPQFAKRFEYHPVAIGGYHRAARDFRFKTVGRNLHRRARRIDNAAAILYAERDDRAFAAGKIKPVQLAARPKDERCRIRRPGHIGVNAGDRPGFLHILIQRIEQFAVCAGFKITKIEF